MMHHGPTEKIWVLSVGISALEQRGHCWMGSPHLVALSLGILAGVPELHVHPVMLKSTRQLGCVFQEELKHTETNSMCSIHKSRRASC